MTEAGVGNLEKTIGDVAKAEGFTYALNAVDGQGNSIVLYGAEGRDFAEKIMTKLGIAIPKKTDATKKAKSRKLPVHEESIESRGRRALVSAHSD